MNDNPLNNKNEGNEENEKNKESVKKQSPSLYDLDEFFESGKKRKKENKKKDSDQSNGKKHKVEKPKRIKEKNESKREKIKVKQRTAVYDPELQKGFPFAIPLGYFCRFFAVALSLFGVIWLFSDAIALNAPYLYSITTGLKWFYVFLYCLYSTCAFSLIFLSRKTMLYGGLMWIPPIVLVTIIYKNPLAYMLTGLEMIQKCIVERLSHASFAVKALIPFPQSEYLHLNVLTNEEIEQGLKGFTTTEMCYAGIFVITTIFAVCFAVFSAKRMRLIPMVAISGIVCVFCFTYNICRTNAGINCILAGLCSAIVLSCYDKIYRSVNISNKGKAFSGFSAAFAGLIAVLILIITTSINSPFPKIRFISEPMEYARNYITTVLTGGNPKNNIMNTLNKKISTELHDNTFTEDRLFNVESYSISNVYLRAWIADDFSYTKDTWSVVDDKEYDSLLDEIKEKKLTKSISKTFTSDDITFSFRRLFNQDLKEIPTNKMQNLKNGYVTSFVDLSYDANTGNLMVIPSVYAKDYGLYNYDSRSKEYDGAWEVYSDGIYKASWYNVYKSYSSIAMLPRYTSSNYSKIAENIKNYYQLFSEYLQSNYKRWYKSKISDGDITDMINEFAAILKDNDLRTMGTGYLEDFLNKGYSEKKNWYEKNILLPDIYTDNVIDNYLEYPENSTGLNKVWSEIENEIESASTDHEKMLVIINYLCKNYNYSQTPEKDYRALCEKNGKDYNSVDYYSSDIDNFLLITKTGYCVQYATVATLLARRAGIPARYVQGYIAADFEYEYDEETGEKTGKYTADVFGKDAHAWCEIYMEGMGWCTYETTIEYYENMYYAESGSSSTKMPTLEEIRQWYIEHMKTANDITTAPPAEITTAEPETPDYTKSYRETVITAIVAGVLIVVLTVVLVIRIRYVKKVCNARAQLLNDAVYKTIADDNKYRKASEFISDNIMLVLKISGRGIKIGQTPEEYAFEVDNPLPPKSRKEIRILKTRERVPYSLTEVMKHIEANEFGGGMSEEGLSMCAEYLRELTKAEYKLMNPAKRLYYRYIKVKL